MKIILVEADRLNEQGQVETTYLANAPYHSGENDTPPNQPYDDFIIGGMKIRNEIDEILTGRTQNRKSSISILNMPGINATDNYAGQQVRIFIGEQWEAKATFKQIYTATSDSLTIKDETKLSLMIKSNNDKITEPLQNEEVGELGYKKPIAYGKCLNVSPVVLDESTYTFVAHDSAITSIQEVRISGQPTGVTSQETNGGFNFSSEPGGEVTADITAPFDAAKDIITDILTRAGVTNVDHESLDELPTTKMCLYLSAGESASEALDAVVNSIGHFWTFKRNGEFTVKPFKEDQAATAEIYPDEIKHLGMKVARSIIPAKEVKVTYNPNWTPQNSSLSETVSLADRERYGSYGDIVKAENTGITAQYPGAKVREPYLILTDPAEAQAEATRRAGMLNKAKNIYQIKAFDVPFEYELGQTITVHYPFLSFKDGKKVIITAISDQPLDGLSTIEVFG